MVCKFSGLRLWSRNHDALAEERLRLVPVEHTAKVHDVTDHQDSRGRKTSFLRFPGNVTDGSCQGLLILSRPPSDEGSRGVCMLAMDHQIGSDLAEIFDTHEKDDGADTRQTLPVDITFFFCRVFMARHKSDRGCMFAMGQWDARIRRDRGR